LQEVAYELSAHLIEMSGAAVSLAQARERVHSLVDSGQALQKLQQMIQAQGGDPAVCDEPGRLPQASHRLVLSADRSGYVTSLAAEDIGTSAMFLGAGRQRKSDVIDPAVGVVLHVSKGQSVNGGDPLATLHYNDSARLEQARALLAKSIHLGPDKPAVEPLIREIIGS
jgi:thymidine phosphorylase